MDPQKNPKKPQNPKTPQVSILDFSVFCMIWKDFQSSFIKLNFTDL